ncbi:hypothetical protein K1719_009132 [Acacia pycnantha]|nr:hypothetical protein K1719_009132 [Acacia pycnantha]
MEIKIDDNNEEERMRDLYGAALMGCVPTLDRLLQQDPLILHRVSSQTTFFETPLHKSALLGHLEFTKTLLAHYPKLALALDSSQRTPLHLASAQGHIDIVRELLVACGEACLVCDQEHRIPLHYAVIRGRRDVVLELIRAKTVSLTFHDDKGKNILHLCVMNNQLEILKDLVALDTNDTNNLLIEGDSDGKNTILHLAIMLKQVETVSYLVSISKIRSEASNLKNDMGYNAADVVTRIPKDSKSLEIQVILMEFEIKCGRKERKDVASKEDRSRERKWSWRHISESIAKWLQYKGNWVEDMRGNLSLVATVLATISFQATTNPPGSVIQQNIRPPYPNFDLTTSNNTNLSDGPLGCMNYKDDNGDIGSALGACPGKALLYYTVTDEFGDFIVYNTISFVASMMVVLLLVSGVPLKHKVVMRVLSISMIVAVTFLLNAYFSGLVLITPYTWFIHEVRTIATWTFNSLNVLVAMYVGAGCILWARNKLKVSYRCVRNKMMERTGTDTANNASCGLIQLMRLKCLNHLLKG